MTAAGAVIPQATAWTTFSQAAQQRLEPLSLQGPLELEYLEAE